MCVSVLINIPSVVGWAFFRPSWVFSLPLFTYMVMPGEAVGILSGGVIATARTPNEGVPEMARSLYS